MEERRKQGGRKQVNNGGNRRGGKRAIRIRMRKIRGEKTREEEMSGTGEEWRRKEEGGEKGEED